ncbi:uncharacterized membrane protein YoaT (DUF817 family) [Lipingzhangella halophila]|uniref:Uncharacterized membrane protein YoaT (DUF817 family) n=1 Tax=Lipingzhangella halophila TaxID=1783352 RepID=A0A7W7RNC2_9ACTN|nr:DUF817 domain-containing protein [Lipingzhangella halophila]MBB4935193.1 uncharacterized membrane protein YoaT (DUF817 family) [Lipingzhangella halophila]
MPPSRNLSWKLTQLVRFAWLEAQACAFAVALFAGLALSAVVPLPIPRYDALLVYGVALTLAFWLLRLETGREVLGVLGFHVVGLAFELFKVRAGSWSYPEPAWTTIAGVPLYSGFMYAAVGSYVARAWRLLDLDLVRYRSAATGVLAVLIYANFFTHHWLPDVRFLLAAGMIAVTWGTWVYFTVGGVRYRMPLSLSFVLIGFFLWVAENAFTIFGAFRYPHQLDAWAMVHPAKFGAWALLVTVSFVLVAAWKTRRGRTSARGTAAPRARVRPAAP